MFAISDDEDDIAHQNASKNDDNEATESSDDNDEPPEVVPINRANVQEESFESQEKKNEGVSQITNPETFNNKNANIKDISKKSSDHADVSNKDYVRILRKRRHEQTFLEKLLEDEIIKERYEILQCLHYVCSNNFFGIGSNENKS